MRDKQRLQKRATGLISSKLKHLLIAGGGWKTAKRKLAMHKPYDTIQMFIAINEKIESANKNSLTRLIARSRAESP